MVFAQMSVCAQSFLEYFLKVPYYGGGTEQGGGGGHGWCYAGGVCTMILQQSLLLLHIIIRFQFFLATSECVVPLGTGVEGRGGAATVVKRIIKP